MKGYFSLVLHSHLPFVKHPGYDYFLEEYWLFEAIIESYLPLLANLEKLERERVDFALTVSLTPPLCEMLSDAYLMDKFKAHLDKLLDLCDREQARVQNEPHYLRNALFYKERLSALKDYFYNTLDGNVLNGYKKFMKLGRLEVITCGATHGFLPLLSVNPKAVEVQIAVAVETHKKHFGIAPRGIWLPECAYYDGLDKILNAHAIEFFFLDSHGLGYGYPTPKFGVYAPVFTAEGVAAFGRDPSSSKEVWSSKEGYPGDFCYRDFYRDVGYDAPFDYIKDFVQPSGERCFTGLKYHKITGKGDYKEAYDASVAYAKTREHAQDFHYKRDLQLSELATHMDRPPLIVSPYDAELFGHWWFEGPDFIYHLFKEFSAHKVIKAITPAQYLEEYSTNQLIRPSPSSWGDKGYYDVWLNSGNDWIYKHLHKMADLMQARASEHRGTRDPQKRRILNQMNRELLLAQASDWAFLMTTQTAVEYSTKRTKTHIANFFELEKMLSSAQDKDALEKMERENSIFQNVEFEVWA